MSHNQLLVLTSYPPRKCGIATYSQDLIHAIEDKFKDGFAIKVCALQKIDIHLNYPQEVSYQLKTWIRQDYIRLAEAINLDKDIRIIYLQHEFGLYDGELGDYLTDFLKKVEAPVVTTFHTILSSPSVERKNII